MHSVARRLLLSPLCHRYVPFPASRRLPLCTTAASTTSHPAPTVRRPRPLKPEAKLTPDEVAEVNSLVPRLCESGHLQKAVRLLDACILTQPDLDVLPLPTFVRRVCCADEADMTHAMALLTALLHNPRCSPENLNAICVMLVDSYLEHRRPRNALKVLDWMCRPKSPCPPGLDIFGRVVRSLCQGGKTLEALRVLREMLGSGMVASDVRECIYKSLLREARVIKAQELDRELAGVGGGDDEEARGRAIKLLDRMVKDWQD